jgi:hypothetical protein
MPILPIASRPNRELLLHEIKTALPRLDGSVSQEDGDQFNVTPLVRLYSQQTDAWTLEVAPELSEAEQATLQAVIDAHDPDALTPQEAAAQERQAAETDLAGQYALAVQRLDAIVTTGPTYTGAEVRDAVVDLARIVRRLLRVVKANL